MLKILRSDRDTYITDRVVKGSRKTKSNVGYAGTLDLFKLYGFSSSGTLPNTELSRLLVHFDLEPLRTAVSAGIIDITSPNFWCKLQLQDVYGGQPTPINFDVSVFPLSASFEEGFGKDVAFYSDEYDANWLSSSLNTAWHVSGCAGAGNNLSACDYITSSTSFPSTRVSQHFISGDENLVIDVTPIISATLSGELPDSGFRISLAASQEADQSTYFVKRFGSRHAYDERKRPRLAVGYDDSVSDDSQNLTFDYAGRLNLYNFVADQPKNLVSGAIDIVGNNCLLLRLEAQVSGAYSFYFTGSQATSGINAATGSYFVNVNVPSGGVLSTAQVQSGSIKFTPIWTSLDETKTYVTGSTLTISQPRTSSSASSLQKYVVGVVNLKSTYSHGETFKAVVNIFDQSSPLIKVVHVPVELPGIVMSNVYYRVIDAVTKEVIVPFDDVKNSTKVSSDAVGMFFNFDTSPLTPGRTYSVSIMIKSRGVSRIFDSASPNFTIDSTLGN